MLIKDTVRIGYRINETRVKSKTKRVDGSNNRFRKISKPIYFYYFFDQFVLII